MAISIDAIFWPSIQSAPRRIKISGFRHIHGKQFFCDELGWIDAPYVFDISAEDVCRRLRYEYHNLSDTRKALPRFHFPEDHS